jgi:hypothetical protein
MIAAPSWNHLPASCVVMLWAEKMPGTAICLI